MFMGLLIWIVLGLIAGYMASTLAKKGANGLPTHLGLGIAGAVGGGWLFSKLGLLGAANLNVWSLFVAVFGAVVILTAWHAIRRTLATR